MKKKTQGSRVETGSKKTAQKGKRTGKLAVKLMISILVPMAILISVCYVYTASTSRDAMSGLKNDILMENSKAVANSVDSYFANYHGILQTMMADPAFVSLFDEICLIK